MDAICALFGHCSLPLERRCDPSLGQRCCGAVAICHLLTSQLEQIGNAALVSWVQDRAHKLSQGPALHIGAGALQAEVKKQLVELLVEKGVPEDKVQDRIADAIKKVGQGRIEEGLKAAKPWTVLKSFASGLPQPFRWLRPEELEAQIRQRADNKFGTAAGEARAKKQDRGKAGKPKLMPELDPKHLVLIEGTFVTEDGTVVPSISLEDVEANAHGVAICSPAQARPFLEEVTSISVEPLAIVSTAPLSDAEVSAQVTQVLRFPAIYGPTSEPILAVGTLIQLGDAKVLQAASSTKADQIRAGVIKVSVYKDQWGGDWDQFSQAPIKCLTQHIPLFTLCKGNGCGHNCPKFHASIDESPDTVIHEVWARKFQLDNGAKATQQAAAAFQVFMRVPASAIDGLQQSTTVGVYVEPRAEAPATGPCPDYAVIWLPGQDHKAALHSKRKTDKALALTRLGHKYGVRVRAEDEEAAFKLLRPEHAFSKVKVTAKYMLHPLPRGLTRQGLQQLLDAWNWAARPLQPTKGTAGAAWQVGAEDPPPSAALATDSGFVLPVQISSSQAPSAAARVLASSKTRRHIQETPAAASSSTEDPWAQGQDPWARYKNAATEAPKPTPGAAAKIQEVHQQLKQEVDVAVQSSLAERKAHDEATESRFLRLEAGLTELQTQGRKFENWFAEAGKRMDQQSKEVGAIQQAMQGQQQELAQMQGQMAAQGEQVQQAVSQAVMTMRSDLNSQLSTQLSAQMEQFQALLSKSQRSGRSRS